MSETETKTETKQTLSVFLDNIGRTVLTEVLEKTEDLIRAKNPVILHVVPDQNGRMSVQLLPIFFREFMASKEDDIIFDFKIKNITESNLKTLDFRLTAQYNQLFGNNNVFVAPSTIDESAKSDNVVKLFDNE